MQTYRVMPRVQRVPAGLRAGSVRGFSLVEVVLVTAIIGVLAAIAVPRFSTTIEKAGPKATRQDLAILQKQIEFYAGEHGGAFPSARGDGTNAAHSSQAFLNQMLMFSDSTGVVSATRSSQFRFGPYLRKGMPKLKVGMMKGRDGIRVVTGSTQPTPNAAETVGWIYNDTTGQIIPNIPNASGDLADEFDLNDGGGGAQLGGGG